jgi:hypothetical protein
VEVVSLLRPVIYLAEVCLLSFVTTYSGTPHPPFKVSVGNNEFENLKLRKMITEVIDLGSLKLNAIYWKTLS